MASSNLMMKHENLCTVDHWCDCTRKGISEERAISSVQEVRTVPLCCSFFKISSWKRPASAFAFCIFEFYFNVEVQMCVSEERVISSRTGGSDCAFLITFDGNLFFCRYSKRGLTCPGLTI